MDLMWKIREFRSFFCIWHLRKAIFHPTLLYSVQYTQLFWSFYSKHLAIRYIIRRYASLKYFIELLSCPMSIAPWENFFFIFIIYSFIRQWTKKFENTYQNFFTQRFDFVMIFYKINLKILINTFFLSSLILGWFFTDKYIHCRIVQVLNIVLNVSFSFSYLCDLFKIRDLKDSKNGNCLFGSFRVYQNCQSFQVVEKVQDLPTLLYRIPLDRGAVAPDMGGPP